MHWNEVLKDEELHKKLEKVGFFGHTRACRDFFFGIRNWN
jgi:hypothetical protein